MSRYYYKEFECGEPLDMDLFGVLDIKDLYSPDLEPGEMITLAFSSPNKNTLTYIYIDGTWQNLRRMVLAREQFYLCFFDRDFVTITIDERED